MVEIQGQYLNLVPALLGYQHDNPEGRDVLCLWSSNTTDQTCCLCYCSSKVSGDIPLASAPHRLKHMCISDSAREEILALLGALTGDPTTSVFMPQPYFRELL